jgi:hypothetical protein
VPDDGHIRSKRVVEGAFVKEWERRTLTIRAGIKVALQTMGKYY